MKKIIFFMIICIVFAANLYAQTPQHYNANTGGIGNTLPFGSLAVSGYMTQWLIGPGEYILPTPAPAGNITKLYIWISSSGSGTYTQLTIKMGQTAITTFPPGIYTGQLDTVYYNTSAALTATASNWMVITLTRPFNYNPAQSLVIQVSHCGFTGSGFSIYQTAGTTGIMRRNNIPGTTNCVFTYSSQDTRILQNGIDIVTPPPATPQYYNYNTTVGANSFPFNMSTGKMVQWLVGPGEFNQPSAAPSGNITAVYFYMAGTATGRIFNNLTIRMGRTSINTLPTGQFYAGPLDTVYHKDTVVLSSTAASWMVIPLDVPFMYYNDSSLVVEVGQCGYTPTAGTMTVNQTTITGFMRRSWSVGGCPFVYTSQGAQVANCGVWIPIPVAVNNNGNEIPSAYKLEQNYPNPFNPVTEISFSVPKAGIVKLIVYDILGREVVSLVNQFVTAGNHTVNFDASNLSSGVYIYKMHAGNYSDSKKMVLMK